MPHTHKPLARTDGLVVHEMPGELLVYDVKADKAHCLNATSASVWKACDGARSVEDLAALVDDHGDAAGREGVVLLALEQFQENNLLQSRIDLGPTYSRRDVVKRIGLTVALPVIASLAVETTLMAASCECVNPGGCLTQTGCPSTVNCNGTGICAP